jgi:hypothetical protein
MSEPRIAADSARVLASWSRDIEIVPGSVPDRPVPYAKDGAAYRPDKLYLAFEARAAGPEVTDLCPEPGDIKLVSLTISGLRLRQDGTPGRAVGENFHGSRAGAPGWALKLADDTLAALVQQAL